MNKSRSLKDLQKQFSLLSEELKPLRHQKQLSSLDENDRSSPKFDSSSNKYSDGDFDRSKLASISHYVGKNNGRDIDFTSVSIKNTQTLVKTNQSSCSCCTKKGMLLASVLVSGQRMLSTHDRRKTYCQRFGHERRRYGRVWRKPTRKNRWNQNYQ